MKIKDILTTIDTMPMLERDNMLHRLLKILSLTSLNDLKKLVKKHGSVQEENETIKNCLYMELSMPGQEVRARCGLDVLDMETEI